MLYDWLAGVKAELALILAGVIGALVRAAQRHESWANTLWRVFTGGASAFYAAPVVHVFLASHTKWWDREDSGLLTSLGFIMGHSGMILGDLALAWVRKKVGDGHSPKTGGEA